jgi:hypothetical protein
VIEFQGSPSLSETKDNKHVVVDWRRKRRRSAGKFFQFYEPSEREKASLLTRILYNLPNRNKAWSQSAVIIDKLHNKFDKLPNSPIFGGA